MVDRQSSKSLRKELQMVIAFIENHPHITLALMALLVLLLFLKEWRYEAKKRRVMGKSNLADLKYQELLESCLCKKSNNPK